MSRVRPGRTGQRGARPDGGPAGVRPRRPRSADDHVARTQTDTVDPAGTLDQGAASVRVGVVPVGAAAEHDVTDRDRADHLRARADRRRSLDETARRTTGLRLDDHVGGVGRHDGDRAGASSAGPISTSAPSATPVTGPGPRRAPDRTTTVPVPRPSRTVPGYRNHAGSMRTDRPMSNDEGSRTSTSGARAATSSGVRKPAARRASFQWSCGGHPTSLPCVRRTVVSMAREQKDQAIVPLPASPVASTPNDPNARTPEQQSPRAG